MNLVKDWHKAETSAAIIEKRWELPADHEVKCNEWLSMNDSAWAAVVAKA
jgi:hypothetical protein